MMIYSYLNNSKLFPMLKKVVLGINTGLIVFSLGVNLVFAADPFRKNDPRPIGNQTELGFKAMFAQGNYKQAKEYLEQAQSQEPNEPLVYALLASLAYQDEDFTSLKTYSDKTLETAKLLSIKDPLRGNLYVAVGLFLQGGHTLVTEGTLKGAPKALNKLQEVLKFLDVAQKIDPEDPELNLIQGYMDLLLSLNLPFSDSKKAINQLEKQAEPRYLVYRGIAVGYKNLGEQDQALTYTEKALSEAPNHPEVLYLKAQILADQGKKLKAENQTTTPTQLKEAQQYFTQSLGQSDQLPKRLVAQIFYEQCKNLNRIDNQSRPCDPLRDTIRDANGLWGPTANQLPTL
ncbi:MAG: Sll0314/Alr1548 family TPR repeat-containing protein [Planktothrix sp.]